MNFLGIELDSPVVAAPMAGVTSPPYRLMAREGGAALVYSEMISAAGLLRNSRQTWKLTEILPEERPMGLQLFGGDPEIMHRAAVKLASLAPDLIDINMGCPVKKVRRQGAGSALLDDPVRAAEVLAAVKAASPLPVTAKIRLGKAEDQADEIVPKLIAAGADAICLHARTVNQLYAGQADWRAIGRVKQLCGQTPLIGNGDVRTPRHAIDMMGQTGCDLVMIGRGAVGDPWLYGRAAAALAGQTLEPPGPEQRRQALWKHLELAKRYGGEGHALHFVRQFMMWYTKGLPGASNFRAVAGPLRDLPRLVEESEKFFRQASEG